MVMPASHCQKLLCIGQYFEFVYQFGGIGCWIVGIKITGAFNNVNGFVRSNGNFHRLIQVIGQHRFGEPVFFRCFVA